MLAACGANSVTGVNTDTQVAAKRGVNATRTEIALRAPAGAPYTSAKGKAKYAVRGADRELQVEAENIPAGVAVTFSVNGAAIGTGIANAVGKVSINLSTELRQIVPMIAAGSAVAVTRSSDSRAIVTGAF